jgi:hypothetical protein
MDNGDFQNPRASARGVVKRLITAALLTLAAVGVQAQTKQQIENCEAVESLAESIMGVRQAGAPMARVYAVITSSEDEELKKLGASMVEVAYAMPQMQAESNRQNSINEFRSKMFSMCITAAKKK